MENRWVIRDIPQEADLQGLSSSLNVNTNLATLLLQRGVSSFDEAKTYFRPSLEHLHDPFLMKGMDLAVNRLCDAVFSKEKILIYGDYDVDGTTAVSVMYSFLKNFTENLEYYIPDRYTEGYGISTKGVEYARDNSFDLIISLDCGIRAVDKAALAKSFGIDLIICDHHLPGPELPDALAILDPKQSGCEYPYKELSGCGVGFKLLQGFCIQNSIPPEQLYEHLDLVAVSIASDIVPITGENRVLAFYGLKKINQSPCPGLKALMNISGLKNDIDISGIVFYIGPRINATGRLSHATDSVKLLTATDPVDIDSLAQVLNAQNSRRKDFDKSITQEALDLINENPINQAASSTVLFKNDWHKGVIGIVASRCIEHYYRPTIILTESNGKATGSARSVEGFDIHEAIGKCADLLEQFGGHTHAAGLTLPLENVEPFKQKFEDIVASSILSESLQPRLLIDLEVPFDFVNYKTYMILSQMSPFGPQNLNPVFVTKHLKLKQPPKILKNDHLKLAIYHPDCPQVHNAIAFNLAHKADALTSASEFSMAYQISENEFRGNKSLQLIIKDIKID